VPYLTAYKQSVAPAAASKLSADMSELRDKRQARPNSISQLVSST